MKKVTKKDPVHLKRSSVHSTFSSSLAVFVAIGSRQQQLTMETITQKVQSTENTAMDYQLTIRLLEMLQRTKYELVQENGQRRLTAPEIVRGEKQRVKGAEIFLGRLPRDCYEDELMPMLEKVGRLVELRLMLDFSGSTRGYAFALYESTKIAKNACAVLDGYEIRPGHRIGVVKSVDNCRLFFGGVPKDKTKEEFMQELSKMLEGITDIYLYPSSYDKSLNRGFIFVEFEDHRAAAMARRKLIPGRVVLWDHEVAVDWADPEPGDPIDEEIMKNVTALFVRNLPFDMTQQKVRDIFQKATQIPILKLKKINHFAFVHYENRQAAESVMNIMTKRNGVAEAEGWEIRWAKPIGATKVLERQRCINEAVAQSRQYKSLRCPTKQSDVKPTVDINSNNVMDIAEIHMNGLQNFVKNTFDAVCRFDCAPFASTEGFLCKITIFKNAITLFEYYGQPKPTKQNAIIAACTKMYEMIATTYQNCALRKNEKVSMGQKSSLNPAVGAPVIWNRE
ncbi:probable RNA-binding protein 46 [Ceratina calcarata]|uniref:Probable RNA-binding protein 46 n=1 Tax=Ceratina calcarata TaxID=156304 RepID=A0AAJ7IZK1_9HYME|nr:probable RNA-binding protein 46 [Ceratina calcarata]